jgi:hypothetical protein
LASEYGKIIWPRCAECGIVVNQKRIDAAKGFNETGNKQVDKHLVGVYCSSDCLLDAYVRGWALTLRF